MTQLLDPIAGIVGSLVNGAANAMMRALASTALDGAALALRVTGSLLASTTEPHLLSAWFSAAYWRVASVSVLLTLPFLFAAAIHALVRSDLALLGRAAFGYLPLALLGVSIAAPLTMLVLGATDEMSALVAGAGGHGDGSFLARAASSLRTPSLLHGDLLIGFVVAMLTVLATLGLWIELLIRGAAVDVIVLMLPLFFAAMVWPARRVWAVRAVETLTALILSKFAIVAVLTLGGAALSHTDNGPGALLTGVTLVILATLSPWALLRILPLHEVAAAAAGGLSQTPRAVAGQAARSLLPSRRAEHTDGESAEPPPEDDAPAAVLGRLRAGGERTRGVHDFRDEDLDPLAHAGVDAVTYAGRRGRAAGKTTTADAPVTDAAGGRSPDARPAIETPFGPEPWTEEFVLGDEGDDRMRPPVIDDPAPDRPAPPASAPDDAPAPPPSVDPPPSADDDPPAPRRQP